MATRLKSKPRIVAETRTPERALLADAISAHAAAVAIFTGTDAAVRTALRAAADDRDVLVAARKAVADAEARVADALVAKAMGTAAPTGPTLEEAHGVVARLEEKAVHHAAAIRTLESKLQEAKDAVNSAKYEIEPAVHAVLKADPATRRLLVDYTTAEQTYVDLRQSVRNIPLGSVCPDDLKDAFEYGRGERQPDYTGARAWSAAIKTLELDPDIELPT
jgi:hypothetical protein